MFPLPACLTHPTLTSLLSLFQAHLRRHIQIHKRLENYNPRQRKLRNVIVQEVDIGSAENEAPEAAEASLITEDQDYVREAAGVQEAITQEPDSGPGLGSGCIVSVVIESRDAVMEEVVSDQDLGHVEAVESFSVPEVSQLVTEAYQTSIDMEGMVESMSGSKT